MTRLQLGRLEVEVAATGITMRGRIDDSALLGDLAAQIPPGDVVIDTAAVTFINSIGVREWTRLLRALRGRGSAVTLVRVADVLMTQMNMFPELTKSVQVISFHAQYVCAACGNETAPLVDALLHAPELRHLKAPQLPCPECGGPMDLADFPERYLTIFGG